MNQDDNIQKTAVNRRSKSKKQNLSILRSRVDLSRVTRRIDFDETSSNTRSEDLVASIPPLPEPVQSESNPAFDALMNLSSLEIINSESNSNNLNRNLEDSNYSSSANSISTNTNLHTPIRNPAEISNETFVPAKDFFSDSFTKEKITSDYFSETDTPSRLKESTKRLRQRKPLNEYIAYSSDEELEEWWKQPKTDYTYSASLSYRERISPERRIGSPNMSRKGLRGETIGVMASPPFSSRLELPTSSSDNLSLRSRAVPRGRLSFYSDESDVEESQFIRSSHTSVVNKYTSVSSSTRSSKGIQSAVSSSNASNNLDYGLDVDDYEEIDSPSPRIVRPIIVRKGSASLLRQAPSSTTSTANSKTYSNSVNGRSRLRMDNHVRGNSVTTITETTEIDAIDSYKNKLHALQQTRWKDVFRKSSNYIYTKITDFFSIICFHVILWSTYSFNFVKSKFSRSRSRSPFQSRTRNYINSKVTTTTVLSRKQTIITYLESTYSWYDKRRKESPVLWGWLPLLLLLLLLIPLFFYLRGANDQENASLKFQHSSNSIESESTKVLHNSYSFLSKKISALWSTLSDIAFHVFGFFKYLIFWICDSVVELFTWIRDSVVELFIWIRNSIYSSSGSALSDQIQSLSSITDQESRVSKSYSFLSIFSTCWTYISKGVHYAWSSFAFIMMKIWTLALEGILTLWHGIMWISIYIWSLLSSLFSGIFGYASVIMTEGMKLPYKAFMLIPFASKSTPPSKERPIPISVEHPTNPTSEELIEQIILNPALHGLISNSIAERERAFKENLVFEVRENLESDLRKLKLEIIPTQKQFEEFASKSEIASIKTQLDNLLDKFTHVETMLSGVLNKEENIEGSMKSIDEMKILLSDVSINIVKLNEEIKSLQNNQTTFEAKLRSCCQNTSVTAEQVRNHVRVLISDLFDLGLVEGQEGDLSTGIREYLGKYFVAKEELENKLNNMAINVETNSKQSVQETMSQTAEQVMNNILEQIRSEMKIENHRLQFEINKNKEDSDKMQSEIRSTVENSSVGKNMDEILFHFIESFSSNEIAIDMKEKLLAALRPLIAISVEEKLNDDLDSIIDEKVSQIVDEQVLTAELKLVQMNQENSINMRRNFSYAFNDSDVEKIVKTALLKYDADKTGMVDHALESGGGSIISTRCTEGYQGHQAELTVLGYSIYRYSTNTPRSIIQPERNPGQCYAFKGSQGFIVIQFAGPVKISAFTLEHIPKALTPSGTIDSAPREFSIYGLQTADEEGFDFGRFVYRDDGEPLQYFPVQNYSDEYFKYVELKIHSNHGNMKYTCIYRFRVHGVREDL